MSPRGHAGPQHPVEGELERVDDLLDEGDRGAAARALARLMEEQGEDPETWWLRPRILERLAEADWDRPAPPEVGALILGDVHKYNESTGTLKVTHDWSERRGTLPFQDLHSSSRALRRGESSYLFQVYPAHFVGPYKIRMDLLEIPYKQQEAVRLLLLLPDNQRFEVEFSGGTKHTQLSLRRFDGEWTVLEHLQKLEKEPPVELGLDVENSRLSVLLDGRRVARARKPTGEFGQLAITTHDTIPELRIEGRVDRSWVRGLRDEWHAKEQAAFRQSWRPSIPAGFQLTPSRGEPTLEGQPLVAEEGLLLRVGDAVSKGQVPEGTQRVKLEAWLSLETGDTDRAGELLTTLVDALPRETWARHRLAELAFVDGNVAVVRALVEDAIANHAYDSEIATVHSSLLRAREGPLWRTVHEASEDAYIVRTDLDLRTAKEALHELLAARGHYESVLGIPAVSGLPPARAYLFSGRAGYLDYIDGVIGIRPESTAGLYSPTLDQLLMWNSPSREALFETLRHEGFHQYAQQAIPSIPLWLNEGLAEVFEGADLSRSRGQRFRPDVGHLSTLGGLFQPTQLRARKRAMQTLLAADSYRFYGQDVAQNYALAWLVAHHLATTDTGPEGRLAVLVRGLLAGESAQEASARCFPEEDLDGFLSGDLRETFVELVGQVTGGR